MRGCPRPDPLKDPKNGTTNNPLVSPMKQWVHIWVGVPFFGSFRGSGQTVSTFGSLYRDL